MAQPPRSQRWTYLRHGHKGRCHTKHNRHPGVHIHIAGSTGNGTGWSSPMSKNIIITGWASAKNQLHIDIRPYWSYRDDLAVIDSLVMKERGIIAPQELKQQVLDQLHIKNMGIEKTKLLMHESVYWVNIDNDIENHIKNCHTCLEFSRHSQRRR